MIAELTKKQRELDDLAIVFQGLRTFVLALRRSTRGKRFNVANTFAWEAVLATNRMLVIDLTAWIDSLLPSRDQRRPGAGWLRRYMQGGTLEMLRASKRRAIKLAAGERIIAPQDVRGALRGHLTALVHEGNRAALERLFGKAATRRGHAIPADVGRLEDRLFRWSENLRQWRHTHAHRYGAPTGTVRALRLADLAKRFAKCGRLLNDIRLLLDSSTYGMTRLDPSENDPTARDLVDLIVVGTAEFAMEQWSKESGQWLWQKRDAYYTRMHRRRRSKKTDSFNGPP